jgi:hypothetical protein
LGGEQDRNVLAANCILPLCILINEIHMPRRDLPLRTIIDRMRHDGCGGAS